MGKITGNISENQVGSESCSTIIAVEPLTIACTKCHVRKARDGFHKNKAKPNGRQAHCKSCTSKQKKVNYKKKLRQQRAEHGFSVSVHGELSEMALASFSNVFAEVVRELVDNEKL